MTQGCARSSLTLGYYICGPSALHPSALDSTFNHTWRGDREVVTVKIYTHGAKVPALGVTSPLDEL